MTTPFQTLDDAGADEPVSEPRNEPRSEASREAGSEAERGAEGEPPGVDPVVEALRGVREELAAGNARAAARERVIDRLHEENQQLKAGERQGLLRPVVTDLYRLRDDLLGQAAGLPADFGAERAAALLESYAQTVEVALERAGVVPVRPRPGDRFDARLHRAVGVVRAAEAAADSTVADVVHDGYRDTVSDRVLVTATVRVARWTPAPEAG